MIHPLPLQGLETTGMHNIEYPLPSFPSLTLNPRLAQGERPAARLDIPGTHSGAEAGVPRCRRETGVGGRGL